MQQPALTPEEWKEVEYSCSGEGTISKVSLDEDTVCFSENLPMGGIAATYLGPADRRAAAALCLHGQPGGLTWEGCDAIRSMLDHAERHLAARIWDDVEYAKLDRARAEVEKIAGLLPPREK